MSRDDIEKTCEQLVEQLGGYNPRTIVIIAGGGLVVGYLSGGLANHALGPAYLLAPLVVCLVAAIVIVAQQNQLTERLLYFYLFRHDFSNSHRPEALWISHFDSLL